MKKTKGKSQEVEVIQYQYGPFIFEQIGDVVRMRSAETKVEFEKRMKLMKSKLPELKNDIEKSILDVVSVLKEYNPFEFLALVNIQVSKRMHQIRNETEYRFEHSVLTYIHNIVTCFNPNEYVLLRKPRVELVIEIFEKIEKIMMNTIWYKATADIGKENEDLIFEAFSKNQFQHHTPSYPKHHIELFEKLFNKIDPFLEKYFDIDFAVVFNIISTLNNDIKGNFNNFEQRKQKYLENNHKEFFSEENGVNPGNFIEKIKEMRQKAEQDIEYIKFATPLNYEFFKISYTNDKEKKFLELISIQLGENESKFGNNDDYKYWPSNESITKLKPVIEFDGDFYCLNYQLLFENIFFILEDLMKNNDQKYFDKTYQKKLKADMLESLSLEYFQKLLPGCKCYQSCYYDIVEDGENKQCEADVIILYDNNIFLIEAKSGVLTAPARRGSVLRIKNDTEKLIEEAYSQCIRTKNYIQNIEKATFTDKKRKIILEIKKSDYDNYFLINTTLEDLNLYSAHLNSLKVFNFLNNCEWIWSVFINDLRIISEIIQTPSEFLSYLKNRIRLNDIVQIESNDELDYFGYHLTKGLYFDEKDFEEYSQFNLGNHTLDLDNWYMGKTKEKPSYKISDKLRSIIYEIEATGQHGFSDLTTMLLDFNSKAQEKFMDQLDKNLLDHIYDKKPHSNSNLDKYSDSGFFVLTYNGDQTYYSQFKEYVEMKIYQWELQKGFILLRKYQNKPEPLKLEIIKKGNINTDKAKMELDKHKREKVRNRLLESGKIHKNELCPCNSGKKYKKCCGSEE